MSTSIGASPESTGPGAEESMPAVVGLAFMGATMGVGPVREGDELVAKTGLKVLGV